MGKEERELLLKDLCGRLSHDIKIDCSGHIYYLNEINVGNKVIDYISVLIQDEKRLHYPIQTLIDNIKPYLRPMESMTEEEKIDYQAFFNYDGVEYPEEYINWLNEKMFDYRGLIEKGLAIAVTEENNPYKK